MIHRSAINSWILLIHDRRDQENSKSRSRKPEWQSYRAIELAWFGNLVNHPYEANPKRGASIE